MLNQGISTNIAYKNYTDTSVESGIPESSSKSDSLINIIKNSIFASELSPPNYAEPSHIPRNTQ